MGKGGREKTLERPWGLAMPDLLREPASTGRAASATEHGSEPEVGGCATSLCVEGWRGGQPCWPCKRAARPSRWRLIGGPLDPRQSTSGSGARRSRAPGHRTVHEETARSQVRSRCSGEEESGMEGGRGENRTTGPGGMRAGINAELPILPVAAQDRPRAGGNGRIGRHGRRARPIRPQAPLRPEAPSAPVYLPIFRIPVSSSLTSASTGGTACPSVRPPREVGAALPPHGRPLPCRGRGEGWGDL